MNDTSFYVSSDKMHRFADCYTEIAGKPAGKALHNVSRDPTQAHYMELPSFESGGGGLVSTARDYYRFCQMMLNRGSLEGQCVLGRKTVEWITRNHLPQHKTMVQMPSPVVGYTEVGAPGVGFGLGHNYIGHKHIGHSYIGHGYIGHNYIGRRTWCRLRSGRERCGGP